MFNREGGSGEGGREGADNVVASAPGLAQVRRGMVDDACTFRYKKHAWPIVSRGGVYKRKTEYMENTHTHTFPGKRGGGGKLHRVFTYVQVSSGSKHLGYL